MANKHRKVWKVVSRKVNSGKQHGLEASEIAETIVAQGLTHHLH